MGSRKGDRVVHDMVHACTGRFPMQQYYRLGVHPALAACPVGMRTAVLGWHRRLRLRLRKPAVMIANAVLVGDDASLDDKQRTNGSPSGSADLVDMSASRDSLA